MFFIGIFGIENKDKKVKELTSLSCKKCNGTTGELIKNYNYFHVFFIPIFKWDEKYYVTCNTCKSLFLISKEKGKSIEQGKNIEVTYWDLQESYENYYQDYYYKVCGNCGNRIESKFKYCPHCGEKI